MGLGIWPAEYALGEAFRYAYLRHNDGYSDSSAKSNLREYVDYGYTSSMQEWQKGGEEFARLIGGSAGAGVNANHALFAPLDRTSEGKFRSEQVDHIRECVLAASKSSLESEPTAKSYNPPAKRMWALRMPNGTYFTLAGYFTRNVEEARAFYTQEEALAEQAKLVAKKINPTIVEI